jgi:hypothetical protein
MSKKTNMHNYISFYNIMKGIKTVSTIESSTDYNEDDEIVLQSNVIDPERLLIKKSEFQNLSRDAKEIIDQIINAPPEFFDLIKTPKRGIISKGMLLHLFSDLWHSEFSVREVFKEIEEWIKTL